MFSYLTGDSINLKLNLKKYVWKALEQAWRELGKKKKKNHRRAQCHIRKYALIAKGNNKGRKGQQKDMSHMKNKK